MSDLAKNILIGIPTVNGCHNATTIWLLVQAQRSFRVIFGVGPLSVEDSRTKVVYKFLSTAKEFTHLLFLDYDIVPPMNVIEALYKHDKDVITANYPLYIQNRIHSSAFTLNDDKAGFLPLPYTAKGLRQVHAIGLGCALIKREVLEKAVLHKCFDLRYGMKNGQFDMLDSDDITFSKVVLKLGYQIWADMDQTCDHYKSVSLAGLVEDNQKGTLIYGGQDIK